MGEDENIEKTLVSWGTKVAFIHKGSLKKKNQIMPSYGHGRDSEDHDKERSTSFYFLTWSCDIMCYDENQIKMLKFYY